jgi:hypothetical protein
MCHCIIYFKQSLSALTYRLIMCEFEITIWMYYSNAYQPGGRDPTERHEAMGKKSVCNFKFS